jgi:hypothetical protein
MASVVWQTTMKVSHIIPRYVHRLRSTAHTVITVVSLPGNAALPTPLSVRALPDSPQWPQPSLLVWVVTSHVPKITLPDLSPKLLNLVWTLRCQSVSLHKTTSSKIGNDEGMMCRRVFISEIVYLNWDVAWPVMLSLIGNEYPFTPPWDCFLSVWWLIYMK